MIYGLTAHQSVMLSDISRALNEHIPLIKTENRLSRNLGKAELCLHLQRALAHSQSPYIKDETLLILDLSDISKKYAEHMQYLGKVRDGSEGVIANCYWTCQVLGVEGEQLIPLYGHLYSSEAPEFRSENLEIFRAIQFVSHFCELHSRMQKLLAKPEALNSDYTRNAAEYNSAFGVNSYEEFATTITHITNVFGKLCHELQTRKGEPAVQLAKLFGEFVQNMPATVQQRLAGSGASPAKYIAAIQHRKKQ